jgi:hypothetical protein
LYAFQAFGPKVFDACAVHVKRQPAVRRLRGYDSARLGARLALELGFHAPDFLLKLTRLTLELDELAFDIRTSRTESRLRNGVTTPEARCNDQRCEEGSAAQ